MSASATTTKKAQAEDGVSDSVVACSAATSTPLLPSAPRVEATRLQPVAAASRRHDPEESALDVSNVPLPPTERAWKILEESSNAKTLILSDGCGY